MIIEAQRKSEELDAMIMDYIHGEVSKETLEAKRNELYRVMEGG